MAGPDLLPPDAAADATFNITGKGLPPAPPGPAGTTLGHFAVLETLGRGGYGVVVKAFDTKLRRTVAIKTMAPDLAAGSPARKRFVREARAAASVRHENVVQIYAVEESPSPYLVMEYIPGVTLHRHLAENGPLPAPDVLRIGLQLARGLAAAHAQRLVHRDVKPGNVLLESGPGGPRVKLTDFGIARAADDASLTQSGTVVGTPLYMSPEQAQGRPVDHRSDLYSLGSVLYEMIGGRPPFRAPNSLAVLRRVAEEVPRPLADVMPETPPWLCAAVAKLQARRPADRFQSAREVAALFERALAAAAAGEPVFVPPDRPARRRGRRTAAAVLFAAGITAAGAALWPARPAEPAAVGPAGERIAQEPESPAVAPPEPVPDAAALVQTVTTELQELNPQFAGTLTATTANGRVVELTITGARQIQDAAPLAQFPFLERLDAQGAGFPDLSPLRGMKLKHLSLKNSSHVRDLEPLRGMPLEVLMLWGFQGTDLGPLAGMPLRHLNVGGGGTKLNLEPLRGMPMADLWLGSTKVDDLRPLAGLPLESLSLRDAPVADLAPLRGAPLKVLHLSGTRVRDHAVLRDMPLEVLSLNYDAARDGDLLRAVPTLRRINDRPAAAVLAGGD